VEKAKHYAEIVRPDMLGQWTMEGNPTLHYLHEAMRDVEGNRAFVEWWATFDCDVDRCDELD